MPRDTTKATAARKARLAAMTDDEKSARMRAVRTDLSAHVRAVVDRAPELSSEQVDRLRAVLSGTPATADSGGMAA